MTLNIVVPDRGSNVASATARGSWPVKLICGALLGCIIGALLGAMAFSSERQEVTAGAFLRLTEPLDLASIAAGATPSAVDAANNGQTYVAGEVADLSGQGFANQVGEALGRTTPAKVTIAQDGNSSVVSVTSTAPTGEEALKTVQVAVDVYRQQLNARIGQQLQSVLAATGARRDAAAAVGDLAQVGVVSDLEARIRLQAQASSLAVLQQPTVDAPADERWLIGALLGGIVGGSLVVLGLSAYRKRSGRIHTPNDVAGAADGIMVPAVELRPQHDDPASTRAVARTLLNQCAGTGSARVITVIGASDQSGTAFVASLLRSAAAETGSVACLKLADVASPSALADTTAQTVVVDAGTLGDSGLVAAAVQRATHLILVARVGSDTVSQAMTVRSATASADVPLMAVLTVPSRRKRNAVSGLGKTESEPMDDSTARSASIEDRVPVSNVTASNG